MSKQTLLFLIFSLTISCCSKTNVNYIDNLPQLKITVVDSSNVKVMGADVIIYKSEKDLKEKINPIHSRMSNKNGVVLFKNLESKIYYFYVNKDNMNNRKSISTIGSPLKINVRALLITTIN